MKFNLFGSQMIQNLLSRIVVFTYFQNPGCLPEIGTIFSVAEVGTQGGVSFGGRVYPFLFPILVSTPNHIPGPNPCFQSTPPQKQSIAPPPNEKLSYCPRVGGLGHSPDPGGRPGVTPSVEVHVHSPCWVANASPWPLADLDFRMNDEPVPSFARGRGGPGLRGTVGDSDALWWGCPGHTSTRMPNFCSRRRISVGYACIHNCQIYMYALQNDFIHFLQNASWRTCVSSIWICYPPPPVIPPINPRTEDTTPLAGGGHVGVSSAGPKRRPPPRRSPAAA